MSAPVHPPIAPGDSPNLANDDWPNSDHLITEDGQPVDGIYSERQMRLLTETLYASWQPGRPFMACANVGVFYINENPAIVPDVFVSVDIAPHPDTSSKAGKSYLMWTKGKPPDIVIEIVSNTEGNELTDKRRIYAQNVRAPYYVVWDPEQYLKGDRLQIFALTKKSYLSTPEAWFPELGLGLKLWQGEYDATTDEWLRWVDESGRLLETGEEQRLLAEAAQRHAEAAQRVAEAAQRVADAAQLQAVSAERKAEQEKQRAELLAAKLREMGVDPDQLSTVE
jgi:Uma2 family endonuclease